MAVHRCPVSSQIQLPDTRVVHFILSIYVLMQIWTKVNQANAKIKVSSTVLTYWCASVFDLQTSHFRLIRECSRMLVRVAVLKPLTPDCSEM